MLEKELTGLWMESIASIAPEAWRSVPDIERLPPDVRADSSLWCERFFTPEADPHLRPAGVQWSYAVATNQTPDAIRYIYSAAPYDLDTIETRAFTVVRLKLRTFTAATIQSAAGHLLQPPQGGNQWEFHLPEALTEGFRFSSNPSADPLDIASWEDLVEGGIRAGAPYFIRFKKVLQLQGYPNPRTWFDSDFRTSAP